MSFNLLNVISKLALASLLLSLLTGCDDDEVSDSRWPTTQSLQELETIAPEKIDYFQEMRFHSVVSGFNSVAKSFFESGRIEKINVVEGQFVEAGTILGTLYSPTLAEELSEAQATLEKVKAEQKLSVGDLARGLRLYKNKVISQQELDLIKRTFDVNEQQVKEAEAVVGRITNELSNLSIVAQESGLISEVFKREGDFLIAGEPLMRFESTGRQKAIFEVPERVALEVALGEKTSMYVPALGEVMDVVAIEKSVPKRGDSALHKLTFEIIKPESALVGLRSVLFLKLNQSVAYKVDYNAVRYSIDGAPYVIDASDEISRIPVNVIELNPESVIVQARFTNNHSLIVGRDLSLPINNYTFSR